MKIEGLKKDTAVWVRGYADGLGDIDFLDGERSGLLDCLCEDDILYMSDSDFRLDEPTQHQLEVPGCIYDLIKSHKECNSSLSNALVDVEDDEVNEWFGENEKEQQDQFARAWIAYPNITIQKEKLYNVSVLGCTLFKMTSDDLVKYKLIGENETLSEPVLSLYKFEANLTEKEIKQADERLWQWAEEVTE